MRAEPGVKPQPTFILAAVAKAGDYCFSYFPNAWSGSSADTICSPVALVGGRSHWAHSHAHADVGSGRIDLKSSHNKEGGFAGHMHRLPDYVDLLMLLDLCEEQS